VNQQTSQVDRFSQQLQTSLRQATERSPAIRIAEHADIYIITLSGQRTVSGQDAPTPGAQIG